MDVTDEILMAYADGELGADEAHAVAQHVANDADAARRLAIFKRTGRTLGALFDAPMNDELPDRLVKAARGDDQSAPSNVVPLQRPWSTTFVESKWAIAASLALAVGAGGYLLTQAQKSPRSSVQGTGTQGIGTQGIGVDIATLFDETGIARDDFRLALETTVGNAETKVSSMANAITVKPELSFASKSGQFCRQYSARQDSASIAGVACRNDAGIWRAEINQPLTSKNASDLEKIVPAGRKTPAEIDSYVDKIISGDVLGQSDEANLIKNGWRKTNGK